MRDFRMIRLLLIPLLAVPLRAVETVKVPQGTPIVLKLVSEIGSARQKKGDSVPMEVFQDVYIDGKRLIKAGTPVQATISDASKRFLAGIGGYIRLEVKSVPAEGGKEIPVQLKQDATGKSNIWSAICGIVCCFLILIIPGEDVTVPAGTLFNAQVLGTTEVPL